MLKQLYIFFIFALVSSCAVIVEPSGGPEDKTSPKINYFEPSPGTLNFQDNSIIIEFDKYMDKNTVNNSVFLSPSKKFELDWTRKKLEIEFEEPLDSNTTYSFSLGTDFTDIYGNKPDESFFLVFSTGNFIDSGYIKGKLIGENTSGINIFAYSLNEVLKDTLNITQCKPNYRTQVGTNGNFLIPAMKDGLYRVVAVKDVYKDEVYDELADAFSAATKDVLVENGKSNDLLIKSGKIIDNSGPVIYTLESNYSNFLSVSFNENIDTFSVNRKSFKILDSATSEELAIKSAWLNTENSKNVNIITENILDTSKTYMFLLNLSDTNFIVSDTLGNIPDTSNKSVFFVPETDYYSVKPILKKLPFNDSTQNIDPRNEHYFTFNMGIDRFDNSKLKISDENGIEVDFDLNFPCENIISIKPKNVLNSTQWYRIEFQIDSITGANYLMADDSLVILNFLTSDIRNYGSASGKVNLSKECDGNVVIILKSTTDKFQVATKLNMDGTFNFEHLPAQTYSIEMFCDENKNFRYDYGNPFPFKHSEYFVIPELKITIKPRWKVEDINLDF